MFGAGRPSTVVTGGKIAFAHIPSFLGKKTLFWYNCVSTGILNPKQRSITWNSSGCHTWLLSSNRLKGVRGHEPATQFQRILCV